MSDEQKRLDKEERRRQFLASRPDLVNAKPSDKPSKAERKAAAMARQKPGVRNGDGLETNAGDAKPAAEKAVDATTTKDAKPTAAKTVDTTKDAKPAVAKTVDAATTKDAKPTEAKKEKTACKGLFDHLPPFQEHSSQSLGLDLGTRHSIHPRFVALGLSISKQVLIGPDSRSIALMDALRRLLDDYECPAGKTFSRHFETLLKQHMGFLNRIRPLSVAMRNVAVAMSSAVSKLDPAISDAQAKRELSEMLQRYSEERVVFAINAIVKLAEDKIKEGDSIMVYARCHLIEEILINAYKKGIEFRVIVVDSGPRFEGRHTLQRLIAECSGLSCSYVLIQSVTFAMKEVSKVFLSATSMMANGAVQGRVGTAIVAVMAQTYHIPCIVCCETRKFSQNAQVNAITRNELCDPGMLAEKNVQDAHGVGILNLAYDITPAHLITMVISEVGCIPASSVPAVTREFMKGM